MRLIVRSSAIHAAGVFTLERIPKGTLVVEYTGTRMKHDDADNLYNERPYTYLFGVGDGTYVVDGYGMAMYLNHSCAPNCETEEDEDEHVWIRAIRDIEPGEELVYDYFLYDGEGDAPCTCGAATMPRNNVFAKGIEKAQAGGARSAQAQGWEKYPDGEEIAFPGA